MSQAKESRNSRIIFVLLQGGIAIILTFACTFNSTGYVIHNKLEVALCV